MGESQTIFEELGLSLLLGLLVGLQRQHSGPHFAGFRTFALVTVAGTLAAQMARATGNVWIFAAALLGVTAIVVTGRNPRAAGTADTGSITTALALLLMFVVGGNLAWGPALVAVVVGAGVAVLLQFKAELHGLAARLGDDDLKAIMQFVLLAFIVLPVLPDRAFGPQDLGWSWISDEWRQPLTVFNPHQTWLMVVLIVGVSLASYVLYRWLGTTVGLWLGGFLGGAISSTATSLSCARQCVVAPALAWNSALVIAIASSVVYLRVLLEIAAVQPELLQLAAGPLLAVWLTAIGPATLGWFWARRCGELTQVPGNPSELKSALAFAAMYSLVLLAASVGRHLAGAWGLSVVAAFSGLTDMDAITLSAARLVRDRRIADADALRMILIAAIANTLFKSLLVGLVGTRAVLVRVVGLLLPSLVCGLGLLCWWAW